MREDKEEIKMVKKVRNSEVTEAILKQIIDEMNSLSSGETVVLATNCDLAERFNLGYSTLRRVISSLPEDIKLKRTKAIQSQVSKEMWAGGDGESLRQLRKSEAYREGMSSKAKTRWANPVNRARYINSFLESGIADRAKSLWADPSFRKKKSGLASERMISLWQSPEFLEAHISRMHLLWQNPAYSEKMKETAKQIALNAGRNPNKVESTLINHLSEKGFYVQDRSVALPGQIYFPGLVGNSWYLPFSNSRHKIPDFKVKGQKKVIEVNGAYWHSKDFCEKAGLPAYFWDEDLLKAEYARNGFDCMIIPEEHILKRSNRKPNKEMLAEIVKKIDYWIKS